MKTSLLLLLGFVPVLAFAQFGVRDNDFDADGLLTYRAGTNPTRAFDVLVQNDGKILVCGWHSSPSGSALHLSRLFPDGSFDNSFGVNGTSVLMMFASDLEVYSMALQPDGKIIVVGGVYGAQNGQVVMRYNTTDGFLDTSFGTNGTTIIPYSAPSFLYDVAVQADGKIVACGITTESDIDVTVVRLNSDGTMDNTFSFDGKAVTDINNADWAQGLVIGSDGKITVAGSTEAPGSNTNTLLVRYSSDGTLDNAFGTTGIVENDLSNSVDEFHKLAADGFGNLYAVGAINNGSNNDVLVVKFNADGSLNNSFATNGVSSTDFAANNDRAWDVLIQPDGKILVGGVASDAGGNVMVMIRLTHLGQLDPTFGAGGKVITILGSSDQYRAVTLQADLKIVAAGTIIDNQFNQLNAVVGRYTSGMNVGIGEVDAYIGSTLVYPNPITNNLVTVEYELNSDETVSIELFDLSGKLITQLQHNTRQVAGSY
ncbi:MAG: hypothetical protein RL266_1670, partial [Bacteroidota bacterium]